VVTGDDPTRSDDPGWPSRRLTGLAGTRVAGYLLEELVGAGGMAVVYRARDERLGRDVALKLFAGDEAVRARFAEEALAAAAVDDPHIIPVYTAGEADGLQFIAMRFVVGHDLQKLIHDKGTLTPERTAAYLSPVATALDAAHAAGLVHRDVKPANILVYVAPGRGEHVYLSDFGVARGPMSAGLTVPGTFLGTPDYGAPEQASGQPVDGRADQYALACVAFELLTGSVPFKRDDPLRVLFAHVYDQPPRLTELRPGLPSAADAVLARALAKDPADRYRSCTDFTDALRAALGVKPYDREGSDGPPSAPTAPPTTATRVLSTQDLSTPDLPAVPSKAEPPPAARR
jgi:serine/threonine protein kinase